MIDNLNTKELLTAWGVWTKTSSGTGFKSVWEKLAQFAPCQDSDEHTVRRCPRSGVFISDDIALRVEHAMAHLMRNDRWSYKLLNLRYRYGYSYQRLAAKLTKELPEYKRGGSKAGMSMCHKTAAILVDDAEQVIEQLLAVA